MNKKVVLAVTIAILSVVIVYSETDGTELLQASDNSFIPQRASFQLKLETYEQNKLKNWMLMDCYVDGPDRYLLIFKDPGIMRGRTQLRLGGTIYSYIRKIDKLSQESAKVSFQYSTLSQEDVMSATLSRFYTVELVEQTTTEQGSVMYSLSLIAKSRDVAYARIVNLINKDTLLPVRRLYYGPSGKLIKEMIIDTIQKNGADLTYIQFRMVDALQPTVYTMVTMNNFNTTVTMPPNMFTQQYMRAAAQ